MFFLAVVLNQCFSCVLKMFGTFRGKFLLQNDQAFSADFQLPITCFDCTISYCAVHSWLLKQSQGMLMSPVI